MASEISALNPVPPLGLSLISSAECRASINSTTLANWEQLLCILMAQ